MSGSSCDHRAARRRARVGATELCGRCIVRASIDLTRDRSRARDAAAARRSCGGACRICCSTTSCRLPRGCAIVAERSCRSIEAAARRDRARRRSTRRSTARWLVAFLRDELIERRGIDARRRRPVRRHRFGGDGVSVRARARPGERLRDPDAVQDLERRLSWPTRSSWSTRSASTADDRDHRAVDGYLQYEPDADPRRRGNVMARMRMLVLSINRRSSTRCRSAPATRRNGCSATSPGTPTTRRRSIRSAISSRRRCGRWRGTSACRRQLIDKAAERGSRGRIKPTKAIWAITYRPSRRDSSLDAARLSRRQIVAARFRCRARSRWCGGASTGRTGSGICRRPRCLGARRSTSSTCAPSTIEERARGAPPAFFPVGLNLAGRRCVVIGAPDDREAIEKAARSARGGRRRRAHHGSCERCATRTSPTRSS